MEKVAFLFPGQGSQYVGMGKDLYENFALAKEIFDRADNILGWNVKERCFYGPQEFLKMTVISQPCIFLVSIVCWELLRSKKDIQPNFTCGLSLGEYSALVCSGVFSFAEGLKLVRKRAEIMEEASRKYPGKMTAVIGLDKDILENICFTSGKVWIANLNCPGQSVISGEPQAVERAKEKALQQGAKRVIDLEVSGAFHSDFMFEAASEFKTYLENIPIEPPKIPVVSNVDALPKYKVSQIKEALVKQLYRPVLWEDSMRFLLNQGINKFYEIGPGRVLKGLMRRINPDVEVVSIEKKEDIMNLN